MKPSALFAAVVVWANIASAQIRLPFSRQQHNGATTAPATTHTVRSAKPKNSNSGGSSNDRRTLPPLQLYGKDWTYVVNASVGTPPQNLTLSLAISASESWVPTGYDWGYGAFAPDNSSTLERGEDGSSFDVTYADGSYAYGAEIRETLWLGGAPLPNLTMGLADWSSSLPGGVLALGFNSSSSSSSSGAPGLPDRLLAEGLVNSTAYSLWLDDASAAAGRVLLGAVDRAAFEPPLVRFPLPEPAYSSPLYSYGSIQTWAVKLASFNYSSSSSSSTGGGNPKPLVRNQTAVEEVVVSVEPTSSVSILPLFLARPIWDLAGAVFDEYGRLALVPCSAASNATARLALQLYGPDGPVIDMPVSDLVLDSPWYDRDPETGAQRCIFGVQNATLASRLYEDEEAENWFLGAPMLKRVYTVFDLANREMGFANVKFGAEGEDVVPFPSYGASIPESTLATKVCDETYEYCPDNSDLTGNRPSSYYDPGLSGGPLVGVVVAGCVAGALVVLGIIWAVLGCARRRQLARIAAADKEKGSAAPEEPEQPPPLPPRPSVPSNAETAGVPQANKEMGQSAQTATETTNTAEHTAEKGETAQVGATKAKDPQANEEGGESSQTGPDEVNATEPATKSATESITREGEASQTGAEKTTPSS